MEQVVKNTSNETIKNLLLQAVEDKIGQVKASETKRLEIEIEISTYNKVLSEVAGKMGQGDISKKLNNMINEKQIELEKIGSSVDNLEDLKEMITDLFDRLKDHEIEVGFRSEAEAEILPEAKAKKLIGMVDPETFKVVKTFESVKDASKYIVENVYEGSNKASVPGNIRNIINKKGKRYGFIWRR